MKRAATLVACLGGLACLWLLWLVTGPPPATAKERPPAWENYLLNCSGCHGRDGVGVPGTTPEEAVRQLVGRTLESAYEVEVAADGPAAVQRLQGAPFDLLITDLKMPGMDGLSVIRTVRDTSDMPIIIITGNSTEASAIEAVNLGVNGYLTKPFRLPRILNVAARALGEPPPAAEA